MRLTPPSHALRSHHSKFPPGESKPLTVAYAVHQTSSGSPGQHVAHIRTENTATATHTIATSSAGASLSRMNPTADAYVHPSSHMNPNANPYVHPHANTLSSASLNPSADLYIQSQTATFRSTKERGPTTRYAQPHVSLSATYVHPHAATSHSGKSKGRAGIDLNDVPYQQPHVPLSGPRLEAITTRSQRSRGGGQSRTWQSPAYQQQARMQRQNKARSGLGCDRSPAWTFDMDVAAFTEEVREAADIEDQKKEEVRMQEESNLNLWTRIGHELPPPRRPRQFADGKVFITSGSSVLAQRSIWCDGHEDNEYPEPGFPEPQEYKYEGPDRTATDRIHRRFLPTPRMPGNETVAWSERLFSPQLVFDRFGYPYRPFLNDEECDIFLRARLERCAEEATHRMNFFPWLEFTAAADDDTPDTDGLHALGETLLAALDA